MLIKTLKTLLLSPETQLSIMISKAKEDDSKPYKSVFLTGGAQRIGTIPAKIVNAVAEKNEFCPV